ncbi:MAG: aldolase, partial [Nocardioidaceae bacterium]|nr:aldolase [Nocardioidaceae bacterium]
LEDGYGDRGDETEDADVVGAVTAIAQAGLRGSAPPFWGVRCKSFEAASRARGLRTLDLALGSALAVGPLPAGFVVTLPKVTTTEQVTGMVEACTRLERAYGLETRRLHFEIQVETPQAILGADGTASVARWLEEADGRCSGLHFGTYDYTAALGIAAAYQSMEHPAADHAKAVMALAATGTRARLSDGSTNIVPVGDEAAVHQAWALHARLVRRHLERGYFQGWDLHPAQLPTRYLATYLFFREGLAEVLRRLRIYLSGHGGGAVMDEPATAQALAAFVRRGVHCGAVTLDEVQSQAGVGFAILDDVTARRADLSAVRDAMAASTADT